MRRRGSRSRCSAPKPIWEQPSTFRPEFRNLRRERTRRLRLQGAEGTVRTYKVLNDGRRQVGAFYLPGDVFGLEIGDEHTFSAEAITDLSILVVKRSAVIAQAVRDNGVARELWAATARELRRTQDHLLLLIKNAQERVASFLLEMADRSQAGGAIELPMSRQDTPTISGSRSKPSRAP